MPNVAEVKKRTNGSNVLTLRRRNLGSFAHTIYQEDLEAILIARMEIKKAAKKLEEKEEYVAAALRGGARIEPGLHSAELIPVDRKGFRVKACAYFRLAVHILVVALLPATCVAQARVVRYPAADRAVFNFPKDDVWTALMGSLAAANVHPESQDKQSCTVFFKTDGRWSDSWGGTNAAVSLMTTKAVKGNSTWQAIVVSGNIYCKQTREDETEVKATFEFTGYNAFAAWLAGAAAGWQRLNSNGYLEREVFRGIEKRLPEFRQRTADLDTLRSSEMALEAARKLDAALKLGIAGDQAKLVLAEASAKKDGACEGPRGSHLAEFCAALGRALEKYAAFISSSAETVLLAGRDEVKNAVARLEDYRTRGPVAALHSTDWLAWEIRQIDEGVFGCAVPSSELPIRLSVRALTDQSVRLEINGKIEFTDILRAGTTKHVEGNYIVLAVSGKLSDFQIEINDRPVEGRNAHELRMFTR